MKINYEKTFQGAHKFYALVGEHLVTRQYFFMSKREALAEFKREVKNA